MLAHAEESPLLARFERLRRIPAGGFLVDAAVATFAPFNATVAVHVESLERGHARTRMKDRFWRRNHLGSLHAMALASLGEITCNMSLLSALPEGASMIVTSFSIEYVKKARGAIYAECVVPGVPDEGALTLECSMLDGDGDVVARSTQNARVRRTREGARR